ncbi:MAG: methyltransferase [Wenzhouxiangella sp.]|jgi:predicted methyltransferase|nr:methyltransferase [Wenzhouxiangella sp.]
MKGTLLIVFTAVLALAVNRPAFGQDHADSGLADIASGDHRPAEWIERNRYRNPVETLTFFGLEPDMTVVELFPGGGWYTSVIAPYVKDEGQFIAAHWDLSQDEVPDFYREAYASYEERVSDRDRYGEVRIVPFNPPERSTLVENGQADLIVTFRNVHGWKRDGKMRDVLKAAHAALKPGGVLGVVGHRMPEDREGADDDRSGYVKQSWMVGMAESEGFRLEAASEINANPQDTADHPNGVWTLLPSLRTGDEDPEKYRAIGESDRFTLKFVKR